MERKKWRGGEADTAVYMTINRKLAEQTNCKLEWDSCISYHLPQNDNIGNVGHSQSSFLGIYNLSIRFASCTAIES
jgi:hypothetical protein